MKRGTKIKIIDRSSKHFMKFGYISEAVIQGKKMKYFVILDGSNKAIACQQKQIVAT